MVERVSHPNIVNLLDIIDEGDRVHIIEELCTGGEVRHAHTQERDKEKENEKERERENE